MKKLLFAAVSLLLLAAAPSKAQQLPDLVQYANTLVGTDSHWGFSFGNTYPSTAVPYPQHSWSPQTGRNGDGWKYTYNADRIRGFNQTHQCSPWMGDYGVISMFPGVGKVEGNQHLRGARYSHDNETAKPHYYAVEFDNGVKTEIAPTERAAHFRFSFPDNGEQGFIVFDGMQRGSSYVVDKANNRVTGWVNNVSNIGKIETFFNHFVIQFDQPIQEFGMYSAAGDKPSVLEPGVAESGVRNRVERNNNNPEEIYYGAYITFKPGTKVQAKLASSFISPEQAQVTYNNEIAKDKTFEETKQKGFDAWNELFNRVLVEGGTEEHMKTFYSCLFRSNLFSHKFYEIKADGTPHYYSPYDGKIHDGYMFTDNGFWDTFRSQFPLTNILHPTMQGRYMEALLDASDQWGWLPAWSAPGETGGMIGNHVISLLTDAYAKGIKFDAKRALDKYKHDVTAKGPGGASGGRAGFKEYWSLGYVPFTNRTGGSTAWTLEYAYDDWCAYNLAKMSGNKEHMEFFKQALYNYKNLFNPETGFFGAKDAEGNFIAPFDPLYWGGPYTEGNQWHYLWSVQHDPQGLIDLFGSDEKFVEKLDGMFTASNEIVPGGYGGIIHEMSEMVWAEMGQYAHGNQPVQHAIYLYNYAGAPWKAQHWLREVQTRLYHSTPQGYPGDEDQGGLSSWYVLSVLGIYAVTPGTDEYVIGSPLFPKATITMEDGKKFVIEAKNASVDNRYIESGKLNGKNLKKNYITYSDIVKGGKLSFVMSDKPNMKRNTNKSAAPYSYTRDK